VVAQVSTGGAAGRVGKRTVFTDASFWQPALDGALLVQAPGRCDARKYPMQLGADHFVNAGAPGLNVSRHGPAVARGVSVKIGSSASGQSAPCGEVILLLQAFEGVQPIHS